MKILLTASEVAPIIKIGGLGDVMGSLPKALEKLGVNADVAIPYYPKVKIEDLKVYKAMELEVPFDNKSNRVEIHKTKLPGSNVDVLMFKNEEYFAIGGKSAFLNDPSETEMFSFFSRAVVEYIKAEFNTYDLIHCQDWHTGLITQILNEELHEERPATLFTIHNLMYQGKAEVELVKELGFSPGAHPLIDYDIQDGDLNLLYQGITSSDYINTVSKTYAEEIKTEEYGKEMAETLRARKDRLTGIVNGIDYSFFPRDFDETNWREKKAEHKKALQKELGLGVGDKPVYSFISRLDPGQKGLDILIVSIDHVIKSGGQFVLLGTGEKSWEEKFKKLSEKDIYKDNISINIEFSVDLANKIYAGSDYFFVPSRYEPCGLTQMISMHYGTPPIVRNTGGLKDTVEDGKTGFTFDEYSSLDLNKAITRAHKLYEDTPAYEKMVENTLAKDFSWKVSAKKYVDLYQEVIKIRKG